MTDRSGDAPVSEPIASGQGKGRSVLQDSWIAGLFVPVCNPSFSIPRWSLALAIQSAWYTKPSPFPNPAGHIGVNLETPPSNPNTIETPRNPGVKERPHQPTLGSYWSGNSVSARTQAGTIVRRVSIWLALGRLIASIDTGVLLCSCSLPCDNGHTFLHCHWLFYDEY